jgi:hypothetical protein
VGKNQSKKRNFKGKNLNSHIHVHYTALLMWRSSFSLFLLSAEFKSAESFPALNFMKIYHSKSKWCPKSKVKVMIILSSQKGFIMCLF